MLRTLISLFLGFGFFGFLVGFITGLTSTEITKIILTTLFAFLGGKFFLNLESKSANNQMMLGIILGAFSLFCFAGILCGVYIRVNQSLTTVHNFYNTKKNTNNDSLNLEPYLRNYEFKNFILDQYQRKEISADSAMTLINKLEHEKGSN